MAARTCDYFEAFTKLVVEVVSTNWQNDCARKVEDYAVLGVPEYWIVDYLGERTRIYRQAETTHNHSL